MKQSRLYNALKLRHEALTERIDSLQRRIMSEKGVEKLNHQSQLLQLELRRERLENLLRQFSAGCSGLLCRLNAAAAILVYDFAGAFENFIFKADSNYLSPKRLTETHHQRWK